MQITRVETTPVDRYLFVQVHTDAGLVGLGEAGTWGFLEAAEEGGFVVKCVELPVATEGEDKEEAIKNIREAIEGYLQVRAKALGKSKVKKQLVEISVKQASSPFVA